jgi:4-diphosphocytidyl-2-C-methyl-D-erythritol kinase
MTIRIAAPAKLTWSLTVLGTRADGYHDLRAEMVTLDLADELVIDPSRDGLVVSAGPACRAEGLSLGDDNLVRRALALVDRRAYVEIVKQIPLGGGLGGGSADAGAILRWAGGVPSAEAGRLGSDVPFCMRGGRAMVEGIGEQVRPLPFVERTVTLLIPPFGVETAAAYAALDALRGSGRGHHDRNDLTEAAFAVEPRLRSWWDAFAQTSGREPVLAGSGSTMFVEGDSEAEGLAGMTALRVDGREGILVSARTVPEDFGEPRDG